MTEAAKTTEQLYAALEDAIRACFADRQGDAVAVDWVVGIAGVNADGTETTWPVSVLTSKNSSPWSLEGLCDHVSRFCMMVPVEDGDD